MKKRLRSGFILTVVFIVSAGLLAGVNMFARCQPAAGGREKEQAVFKEVMPQAAKFIAVRLGKEILYYRALDSQDKLIGFVFKANGKGYSGVIETLAGMFPDGKISAIKIVSSNETPGLGMRVAENSFTSQFNNQDALSLSGVQAITGATISSSAVINSVIKKAQEIKELIRNKK